MKTHSTPILFSIALLAWLAAGCASAPSQFYSLNSTATGNNPPPANYAVVVSPVTIPADVDRAAFTLQVGPNRVEIDEFNRWDAPLNESISRVVAEDLAALLGTPRVATAPLANLGPAYRVTIDVERFESMRGEAAKPGTALIEAVWVVRGPVGDAPHLGRTVAREPAQGDGFEALAAAHSRALAKVSEEIAAAIRAEAGDKQ